MPFKIEKTSAPAISTLCNMPIGGFGHVTDDRAGERKGHLVYRAGSHMVVDLESTEGIWSHDIRIGKTMPDLTVDLIETNTVLTLRVVPK